MKIFISWSGEIARQVAEKLRTWLRRIVPLLDPFVSSVDMPKGTMWIVELFHQLEQSSVAIICVTRENLHSDWLLFEAGALADQMSRSKICTLFIDISPLEVRSWCSVRRILAGT
jgi:hypothetical protein